MFFDRPETGQSAFLLSVRFKELPGENTHDLDEFAQLADSAGYRTKSVATVDRRRPDPKHCIGSGKVDEIRAKLKELDLNLLLVDCNLTTTQQRNLEGLLEVRVMTRTELILHLFADRARTHEGKLQVELALLRYAQSHLVRGWSHLDRQRGGVNLRGVGETQLAIDRRLVQSRIKVMERKLEQVRKQRLQQRRRRQRSQIPTIAIVGYTNAGKSTLFNALANADVYADNRLFATLDPTLRRIGLAGGTTAVLADTVGFVKALPMDLVAAFKATLEEVTFADVLLHVMDASVGDLDTVKEEVMAVLKEIGAAEIPVIEVFNKVDKTEHAPGRHGRAHYVSATERTGLDELVDSISNQLLGPVSDYELMLDPCAGKLRSELYGRRVVRDERFTDEGKILLAVTLAQDDCERILAQQGVSLHR